MQQPDENRTLHTTPEAAHAFTHPGRQLTDAPTLPPTSVNMQEVARAAERARLRQGIMHVRIRHFYCTLEEMFDASLHGQSFVVGTGMGRPNEPGRVIDASTAAMRLGVTPGMPLRRAHRIAPRTRFMPASYDRYQPILQRLRERYRAYSRIIEHFPGGVGGYVVATKLLGNRFCVVIGSALLVDDSSGDIRRAWLAALAADIARCRARGQETIIVSSGAIAVGRRHLGLAGRALKLEEKQAAAATDFPTALAATIRDWHQRLDRVE